MDYLSVFDISGSGMSYERTRLDVTAINIANANTTQGIDGTPFKPLRVVASPRMVSDFDSMLSRSISHLPVAGVEVHEIRQLQAEPRMAYDPGHPDADEKGFVAYPSINTASEMINLISATRSYEANVRAMNAAKSMSLKALQIGGGR